MGSVLSIAQEAPLVAGQNVEPPKLTVYVKPQYPVYARERGIQGLVVLEFIIDAKGEPHRIRVLRSIPDLDPAAVHAVENWRYEPIITDGVAREVIMSVPVAFFQSESDMLRAYIDIAKRKIETVATRVYAISRLGEAGSKRRKDVTKTLQGLARDPEAWIRSAAEEALRTLQTAEK